MRIKALLKKLLCVGMLACVSMPVQAKSSTVDIHTSIQGNGTIQIENRIIDQEHPQTVTVEKGNTVTLDFKDSVDQLQSLKINGKAIRWNRNTYSFVANENTSIQAQFMHQRLTRAENTRVEELSIHNWSVKGVGSWSEGIFLLSNGAFGFCGNAAQAGIRYHQYLEDPVEFKNENARKVLYYGCKGPKDILTSRYGFDGAVCITNELCSKVYSNNLAADIAGLEGGWTQVLKPIYEEILSKPDPYYEGYTAYVCKNTEYGENWFGEFSKRQDVLFGKMDSPRYGTIQIQKSSSQEEFTKENPYYSLKNAEYGVYSTKEDAQKKANAVGILKTDENGKSQSLQLKPATYFIREIKAPQGFLMHKEILEVKVESHQTLYLKDGIFKEEPQTQLIDVVLKKLDKTNQKGLANAQFKIEYYKPNAKEPSKTWIETTDQEGKIGPMEFLLGTIRIQEVKAPSGYVLNPKVITKDLREVYNVPIFENEPNEFVFKKVQKGNGQPISQAEFIHTTPSKKTNIVKTDEKGECHLSKLEIGKHTIKETKVKDGYVLNPTLFEFEVREDGSIEQSYLEIEDEVEDYQLIFLKKNEKNQPLTGAEFTLYEDASGKKVLQCVKSENGKVVFSHLKDGKTYYVKETAPAKGYALDANPHMYEVCVKRNPEKGSVQMSVDGKSYNQMIPIEVINRTGHELPRTGSFIMAAMIVSGMICITYGVWKGRKHEQ